MPNKDELAKLIQTLKRRNKSIAEYKARDKLRVKQLRQLENSMEDYKRKIDQAKDAMLVFIGLENLMEDFVDKVESEFHLVRKGWGE